jgi:hypothetical protein
VTRKRTWSPIAIVSPIQSVGVYADVSAGGTTRRGDPVTLD